MKDTIVAVIPVRAGSTRLKNKNILPFGESNLLIHKIRQLKQIKEITSIVVSSDSEEMLDMALKEEVLIHKRAPEYCDEKTKTFNEVVENIASEIQGEHMLWAPCVCPLVETSTYKKAIQTYKTKVLTNKQYGGLISAKKFNEYLISEEGPINFSMEKHQPSQELPPLYVVVNGFYIFNRKEAIKNKYFYASNPYKYVLSKIEATDIDDLADFEFAEFMYKKIYGK